MSKKNTQAAVVEWASKIGERAAQAKLVAAEISPNLAQKLTSDRYPHKLRPLTEAAILKAMSEDDSDKAS